MKPVSVHTEKSFGVLDFVGRPTLVVKIRNHVPAAVKDHIRVWYTFEKHLLLIEPIYLMCGILSLFILSIASARLNLDFK